MTKLEFDLFVEHAYAYFQKPKPKDNALRLWWGRCRDIPFEAIDFIENAFQEMEGLPNNVPSAVWALYCRWLHDNPEKKATAARMACDECKDGWLFADRYDEATKRWHTCCSRCACDAAPKSRAIPTMRKRQMIDLGYVFDRVIETGPVRKNPFADSPHMQTEEDANRCLTEYAGRPVAPLAGAMRMAMDNPQAVLSERPREDVYEDECPF